MLTLERPRPAHTRHRKKERRQTPQTHFPSDSRQEERRFRRCLEWGATGISVFLILVMFYLFDGAAWVMGIAP